MQAILSIADSVAVSLRKDMRLRWGIGAGASVLLSASVFGLGGSVVPSFLHASTSEGHVIQAPIEVNGFQVLDMGTSTVSEVIAQLPKAERFELMLYNSGAGDVLKKRGDYTVFVPASAYFDYLPKRYIAGLSRRDMANLALGHIVSRSLPIEESLSGNVITLGDTAVTFDVDAEANAITVGDAKVLKAYKASNGWVYIINKVLVDSGN